MVPDLGLIATLPRAIGMARARDMLLTSRKVPADEALQMGLVARVTEPAELMPAALEAAHALASGPTMSLGLIKRLLQRAYDHSFDEYLEAEGFAQAVAMTTEDFEEGVAAFKEKRKPRFQGEVGALAAPAIEPVEARMRRELGTLRSTALRASAARPER